MRTGSVLGGDRSVILAKTSLQIWSRNVIARGWRTSIRLHERFLTTVLIREAVYGNSTEAVAIRYPENGTVPVKSQFYHAYARHVLLPSAWSKSGGGERVKWMAEGERKEVAI